jgi:hypothetical protein
VKFHDGSAFTANAVVWNVRKVLDKAAPHFDTSQVGVTASRMPMPCSARKIDDLKVELVTSELDAFLPRLRIEFRQRQPAHAALGRGADLRQILQRLPQSRAIDRQRHVGGQGRAVVRGIHQDSCNAASVQRTAARRHTPLAGAAAIRVTIRYMPTQAFPRRARPDASLRRGARV